jgi:hypothetical protein
MEPPPPPGKTLAEVLNTSRDVFERARALLPSIPEATKQCEPAPATMAEALALIQERANAAAAAQQSDSKAKGGSKAAAAPQPQEQGFPGARIGGATERSAFWTLVQVGWECASRDCVVSCCCSCCCSPEGPVA